jgi:Cu-Zn family superoxide dismutase
MKRSGFVVAAALLSIFMLIATRTGHAEGPLRGVALIKGTAPDSPIRGIVKFTEIAGGLKIEADISGVPNPGDHGFHIHDLGSCDDMGKAAGGHFNPKSVPHGLLAKDGHDHAHAGDMGNITVDQDGHAVLDMVLPGLSLSGGMYNVAGRSVIVHEKLDDFSQPTGNAGGRIGCGLIIPLTGEESPGQ